MFDFYCELTNNISMCCSKKITIILISCLFLFTSCNTVNDTLSTINETLSTGYDSLKDGTSIIKKSINSSYDKTKAVIIGE
tara:strand:+ start:194 stop:436 length:243 start_codon:yes stop_codon:yes gene_type:complete